MKWYTQELRLMVFFLPALCLADAQNIPPETARRLELIKASEDIIEFRGRLADQFGKPVEGATVTFHVGQAALLPKAPLELRVVSDSRGDFGIDPQKDAVRGAMLSIVGIEKEGYEYKALAGEKWGFDYRKNNPNRHTPNKACPVVFHMRKKGANPTFLFQEMSLKFQVPVADSGKAIGYDFVQRGSIRNVANPAGEDAARVADLQVKATINTNDATWAVVLSPDNTNGGILVSDQLLYEAPETGYQPEYTLTPEDRKPVKAKYVYLKSRNPAIYTRYEIVQVNANKEFFRLSGRSMTNPYGELNLEQATDLPYEVTKQLADEAKVAFHQNKRPLKPDLPKLINDAKDKGKL